MAVRRDLDRVEAERAEGRLQLGEPRLVCGAQPLGLFVAQADAGDLAGVGIDVGHDEPGDIREARVPDRVLDQDRHDVPAPGPDAHPRRAARRHEEVRQQEQERAGGHIASLPDELLEPALDVVARRAERAAVDEVAEVALSARRPPHLFAVRAQVEIADEAAGGDGAVGDQLRGDVEHPRLVEPRQRLARRGHRRPAVAEDDDARRLLRVVLAHDELIRPACNRQARGRGPVDHVDVVTRAVRARAGDVGADAAPGASHRREREADHPPVLD